MSIAICVLAIPGSLYVVQSRHVESVSSKIREYHNAVDHHAEAVREEIFQLTAFPFRQGDALATITKELAAIRRLEDRFAEADFSESVARSEAQFQLLQKAFDARSPSLSGGVDLPQRELAALATTALQLSRLHRNAARRELVALSVSKFRYARVFAMATIFSFGVAVIFGVRIFRSLRRSLEGWDHTQIALEQSERRHRAIAEATFDTISEVKEDFSIVYLGRSFSEVLGYEAEEFIDKSHLDFVPIEERDSVLAQMPASYEPGVPISVLCPALTRQGEKRWFEATVIPFEAANGEIHLVTCARDITELREADRRLKFQAKIIEEICDAVVTLDLNGVVTSWNAGAERLFGYAAEEAVGREVFAFMYPEFEHPMREQPVITQLIEKGSQWLETQLRHKSGRVFDAHVLLGLLRDEDGTPEGMFGYSIDTTEQRQAERRLRISEERFRAITDYAGDLISEHDAEGLFTYVNSKFRDLLGYGPGDLVGRSGLRVIHPADREIAATFFEDLGEIGRTFSPFAVRFRAKDGHLLTVETSGATYQTSNGERRVVMISRDLSDRLEAERERRLLSALVESSSDFIEVSDLSGHVTYLNPSAMRILGLDLEGNPKEGIPGEGGTEGALFETGLLAELLRTGSVSSEVELSNRRTNQTVPLEIMASTIRDENSGEPVAFTAIGRDLTESRRAQAEREALESQLRTTQKLESLGVLAGGVAHDFNNMLAIILSNTSRILEWLHPNEETREHLETVRTASLRAADFVKQLLTYAGHQDVELLPVDLSEIVEESQQFLERVLPPKITLRFEPGDRPLAIDGEPAQLQQVVVNLVNNAADAIGDVSGIVTIRTGTKHMGRRELDSCQLGSSLFPGRFVYLEVADSGCGIDAVTLGQLFDPFFTTKFAGRGLGLAAVLGIVRGHRGAIEIWSEPGRGARFKVFLPSLEGLARRPEPVPVQRGCIRNRYEGTILVVDDEPMLLRSLELLLQDNGLSTIAVTNGKEAVKRFREDSDSICAVVLDMKMPEMSGEEVLIELRKLRFDVPIVISSGYGENVLTGELGESDFTSFIQKPYQPDVLIAALDRLLEA